MELVREDGILKLSDGTASLCVDLDKCLKRCRAGNLEGELIVKAARIKGEKNLTVLDATAGLGEDSFLLAAAGFTVVLFEKNPLIAELLEDGVKRARGVPGLKDAAERMSVHAGDSVAAMNSGEFRPDVVFLDPMFPKRKKSALVKKKFQLLHNLEAPCDSETELLDAALNSGARRIVIKRPAGGPFLAGRKPDYSYRGKAVRIDCFINIGYNK